MPKWEVKLYFLSTKICLPFVPITIKKKKTIFIFVYVLRFFSLTSKCYPSGIFCCCPTFHRRKRKGTETHIKTEGKWHEWKWKWSRSIVSDSAIPWTVAYQVPPSMGFCRQEHWSGLPFPSQGDLPNPGTEPRSPVLQADGFPSEPPGAGEGHAKLRTQGILHNAPVR